MTALDRTRFERHSRRVVTGEKPRGLVVLVTICVLGFGCSGDDGGRAIATSTSNAATDTSSRRTNSGSAVTSFALTLSTGAAQARTTFEAEDPTENTQTVTVIASRSDVTFTLDFITTGGSTLSVLDPDRTGEACQTDDGRTRCTIRFPVLEAQLPGEWQAIASKTDGDALDVEVSIAWEHAS